ncbi:protein kinase [Microbulbifer sp. CAU 1566]|uniref:serine/threonine-protein kinase n=1 Tax=Microbulbifer sp. CAU 1566 TaxID=2933269 RepID=UPI002003ADD6|nr:serine/threonine-protein kinase [Microbulbifer sp. CAU 1566]MCK7596258.1 protein kinase [Microbulbifer sp. CAU 1566]
MDIADPEVGQQTSATSTSQSATELPGNGSERYRINSTLGAGGMGIVYLADDLKLHRQVAIKKLRDDVASQNARDRIQQEARLLAQLNHPNIVALHDVLEESLENGSSSVALVMEYIEGTTLRAWMRERSPSLQQKLSLLMQICQGLTQAHDLGIIHRDLKSDNILIAENTKGEPVAKITDFGIAKSQQLDEKTLTLENQLAGTITAMSPEQILGKTLDARSDLFSLGTIAFELLTGSRPFAKHEAGALAMANRITSEPHTPPQQAWVEIPEPLAVLLDKLLAKDPAQRPQSALIVYQGFELLYKQGLESDTDDYTATLTDLFTHHKVKSRRRWQHVLAGVAAALLLSTGGYWGWKEITRLEPHYIAVMPVEINGEIRGEENSKTLTRTMVRQALMNSVSQLKASALVSFEPKEGMDFEEQLQVLRNKGATDALFAHLTCAETRCNTEIQRISPLNSHIVKQKNITILSNMRQESAHSITNTTSQLFEQALLEKFTQQAIIDESDYEVYLQIADRAENRVFSPKDLDTLEHLSVKNPKNINIYRTFIKVAIGLFLNSNEQKFLNLGSAALDRAKRTEISTQEILKLEVELQTHNKNYSDFESLISKAEAIQIPPAEILSEYARFLYNRGEYVKGQKYAEKSLSYHSSESSYYTLALNLYMQGKYSSAISNLKSLIKRYPTHWNSYGLLGGIYLENGNYAEAESFLNSIPDQTRSWHDHTNLGVANYLQKKYNTALENYKIAANIAPNNLTSLGNIAEVYVATGDTERYTATYEKILELTNSKSDIESRMYRALSLAYLGKTSESINEIYQLNKDTPNDTNIKYASAQIYSLAQEYQSAAIYMGQLVEQGMSTDWFSLPPFQEICTHTEALKSTCL